MPIDFHAHLGYAPIYPERYLVNMFSDLSDIERNKFSKIIPLMLRDIDGSEFVRQMDIAAIDKAVLLIIDGGLAFDKNYLDISEIYRVHKNVLEKYPDRFIVFAGMDPRRGKTGFDLFRRGIENYKFRGLKLYPPMGYSVNCQELIQYYEYCNCHNLPILFHTGPSQKGLANSLANPLFISSISEVYPRINFILAHAGFNLSEDLIRFVSKSKNVFIDIAGFQSKYRRVDAEMLRAFEPLFLEELNSSVLFGSDWPLFNLTSPLKRNIDILTEINKLVVPKQKKALENILQNNAFKILKNISN